MKLFQRITFFTILLSFTLLSLFIMGSATAKSSYKMPLNIDISAKYLFFMHGAIVENRGPKGIHPKHPEWGPHDYYGILKSFENKGFVVISEERSKGTKPPIYSKKVAKQVRALLDAGVPPNNITVSGFSRGGAITLLVSTLLKNPKINFVVLAGCCKNHPQSGRKYKKYVLSQAKNLHGQFLSICDIVDDECQSCKEEFKLAKSENINSTEIKMDTGLGHGLFWKTREEWLEPMVSWINRSHP